MAWFYLLVLIFCCKLDCSYSYRVSEKIYDNIQGNSACFKRLNGTSEVGCTSSFYGNVGIVHLIKNDSDLEWVLDKGPHSPYILALLPNYFTREVLNLVKNSTKVTGVLLIKNGDEVPADFTGEKACPNRESSLYRDTPLGEYCDENPWNPHGSSLLFESWNFPIFLIDQENSVKKIVDCFNEFNIPFENGNPRDWPLCAMELRSSMFAATSSEVCLRRSKQNLMYLENSFCDPLEDYNIWSSLAPLNKSENLKDDSIILVSTSADAFSLFDNRSPGAETAVSGLVTLLATAEALFRDNDFYSEKNKNVMFAILQGESWDYIGSSRMVFDMERGQFPYKEAKDQEDQMVHINMSHIEAVIDLAQVGLGTQNIFLHSDPLSNENPSINEKTQDLIELLKKTSTNYGISFKEANRSIPLPPSSLQTFLKAKNVSGLFISDFEREYTNKYSQSVFDDYKNLNFTLSNESSNSIEDVSMRISAIASILASSLQSLATNSKEDIRANATLVNKLMYCYLKNVNCSFFQTFCDEELRKNLYEGPARMFISVKSEHNLLPYITGRIFSYLTGEIDSNYDKSNCTSNTTQVFYHGYYPFIDDGVCIRSTVHYTTALSPAFILDNYNWASGIYSTWTESHWSETSARIFLRPSFSSEMGLIAAGIICTIISAICVHFFSARAGIIFACDIAPAPI